MEETNTNNDNEATATTSTKQLALDGSSEEQEVLIDKLRSATQKVVPIDDLDIRQIDLDQEMVGAIVDFIVQNQQQQQQQQNLQRQQQRLDGNDEDNTAATTTASYSSIQIINCSGLVNDLIMGCCSLLSSNTKLALTIQQPLINITNRILFIMGS